MQQRNKDHVVPPKSKILALSTLPEQVCPALTYTTQGPDRFLGTNSCVQHKKPLEHERGTRENERLCSTTDFSEKLISCYLQVSVYPSVKLEG